MKKIDYSHLRETVYTEVLPNGLKLVMIPKPGFSKVYSTFATHFGSFTNSFSIDGESYSLPMGVAHFLEHQLFESADGMDITSRFALLGADCNAYTDYQETAYITVSTSRHLEVIELLLNYVQTPQFSEQSVEEERGIIEQERSMYIDRASVRALMGVVKNMYATHPVREDIVGTKESIQAITYRDLKFAYDTFYHPSNMILVIVGDISVEEIRNLVVTNQEKKVFPPRGAIKVYFPEENACVVSQTSEDAMDIAMPKAVMGVKLPLISTLGMNGFQVEVILRMILEEHFGLSSANYQNMLDNELFNTSFSFNFYLDKTVGYLYLSANTKKPHEYLSFLEEIILSIPQSTMSPSTFEVLYKATHGSLLKSLNSLEAIAHNIAEYQLANEDFFAIFDSIRGITLEDLHRLDHCFTKDAISTFIIKPIKS